MVYLQITLMPFKKASTPITENAVKPSVGRPTKLTVETIMKLEQAFGWGCSDAEAALFADISAATLYRHIQANPEFALRRDQLKETPILKARVAVINGFENDPILALKYLERKRKKEFSVKTENTSTVTLVAPILGGLTKGTAERVQNIIDMEAPKRVESGETGSSDTTFDVDALTGDN